METREPLADLRKLQRAMRMLRLASADMARAFDDVKRVPGAASTQTLHDAYVRQAEAVHSLSMLLELLERKRGVKASEPMGTS